MKQTLLGFTLVSLAVSPAIADHNNPWASPTDIVLSKNHDANQLKSVGTPGQDEMKGKIVQYVNPKAGGGFSGAGPADGSGKGSGSKGGGGEGGGHGGRKG